jgi:hypothetical protein
VSRECRCRLAGDSVAEAYKSAAQARPGWRPRAGRTNGAMPICSTYRLFNAFLCHLHCKRVMHVHRCVFLSTAPGFGNPRRRPRDAPTLLSPTEAHQAAPTGV